MKRRTLSKNNFAKIVVTALLVTVLPLLIFTITGCSNAGNEAAYTATYDGNGNTSGTVPVDSKTYIAGDTVTVLGNTGTLIKAQNAFAGWNGKKDGTGTNYPEGGTFTIAADVTLYANWTVSGYAITFDKNDTGAAGTMADQTIGIDLSANLTAYGFTKEGSTFAGWATTAGGAVVYADGASYFMGRADVTLYAKWTPNYSLRDTGPAGGLIFYAKDSYSNGWRYLEAAPVSTEWASIQWSSNTTTLIGGTGTAIGDGNNNTTIVADWLDSHSETGMAAQLCRGLTEGGKSDWFLPSKDELDKMYVNLKSGTDENGVTYTPVGGFAASYYWSSSEYDSGYVWVQYFDDGSLAESLKSSGSGRRVRAVRAF